jgi:hypothetical protein
MTDDIILSHDLTDEEARDLLEIGRIVGSLADQMVDVVKTTNPISLYSQPYFQIRVVLPKKERPRV